MLNFQLPRELPFFCAIRQMLCEKSVCDKAWPLQGIETMWEDIAANDPEWNGKLVLVPGLTDAWSGELKETCAKASEEFVVCSLLQHPAHSELAQRSCA